MINREREQQLYEWFFRASKMANRREVNKLRTALRNRIDYEIIEALKREFFCLLLCGGCKYVSYNGNESDYLQLGLAEIRGGIRRDYLRIKVNRGRYPEKYFNITDETLYPGLEAVLRKANKLNRPRTNIYK